MYNLSYWESQDGRFISLDPMLTLKIEYTMYHNIRRQDKYDNVVSLVKRKF